MDKVTLRSRYGNDCNASSGSAVRTGKIPNNSSCHATNIIVEPLISYVAGL